MIATDHAAAFTPGSTYRARLEGLRLLPSRQAVLLAADWAEMVLPVWEGTHPDDPRPRRAIEAARSGGRDAAAYDAAYDAAYAAYAAAYAAYAAAAYATYADADAAYAAAYAAYAAAYATYADADAAAFDAAAAAAHAAHAADWSAVRRFWESAYHDGHVWHREWGTPLAVELARDPEAYPVLLDLLEDQGVPVGGLRGLEWTRSNWAVYHLTEGKP